MAKDDGLIFVKPVEGRRCKDPVTCQLIPEAGRNVPSTAYWLKRIKQGDCVKAEKSTGYAAAATAKDDSGKTDTEATPPKATRGVVKKKVGRNAGGRA